LEEANNIFKLMLEKGLVPNVRKVGWPCTWFRNQPTADLFVK